jgi:hypothetical protein
MRKHTRRIQRVVFGMGMVAAMGFGAVQAVATPAQANAAAVACTPEQDYNCMTYCLIQKGGDGWLCDSGRCICW